MKNPGRILLGISAVIIGGLLGHVLLPGFDGPFKMMVFFAACAILGEVFHQVDKMIYGT